MTGNHGVIIEETLAKWVGKTRRQKLLSFIIVLFFWHVLKSKLLRWPVSNHARPMADPAPMADPRWAPVAPGRPAENAGQRGLADGPPASQFAQEVRKPKLGDNDFDAR